MASNEQSVTLLRQNKLIQIAALNALGFNLTESARAADFPMYLKWGSGLLDVAVAANRKTDNKKFFFSKEEWQSLSETEKSKLLLRGVRVRAHGFSFVMGFVLLTPRRWGPAIAPEGYHNQTLKRDLYKWDDAYNETALVRDFYQGKSDSNCTGAPAAEAAMAYRAYTLESDGIEDTTPWCLPAPVHAHLMMRYRNGINEVIQIALNSDYCIKTEDIWTCLHYVDSSSAYRQSFNSGSLISINCATNECSVRVISLE